MLKLEIKPYTLQFKFNAKTSRGTLNERLVWFLKIRNSSGIEGVGEVAPIHRLSFEDIDLIPSELEKLQKELLRYNTPRNNKAVLDLVDQLVDQSFSSIRMGLEMALLDLMREGEKAIFPADLSKLLIPVNGLVWMGDRDFMEQQIRQKLEEGYQCIKLKIGSLDFQTELAIVKALRNISDDLVIRLDANGAFPTNEVLAKLKKLSRFNIHSIEQPILPSQIEALEMVCKKSEIPIALDEELIGIFNYQKKLELLQEVRPQYLVLKPSLHGGFSSVKEWIDLAEIQGIDWWVTSYLESNIGLNALAQFVSQYELKTFQGLGTGGLYSNNIKAPMQVAEGYLSYTNSAWGPIG